jgi:hypothetical protein
MKTRILYFFNTAILIAFISLISCTKDDDSALGKKQSEVKNNVQSGIWRITYFNDSGNDETNHFTGFDFTFGANSSLTATNGTTTYVGTWSITDSNSNDDSLTDLHFNIHFNLLNDFEELNDDWEIISQSSSKLELKDVSGGGSGTDYLTFEKK